MGCSMCGSCGSEHVDGVEYGGAWRWRLVRAAYGASGGGGGYARRRRKRLRGRRGERARPAHGGGSASARRRCELARKQAKTEKEERTAARARHIYDKWALRFFLTPVKPMLRFRTPVDYIGSVYPKLQQKFI